MIFLDGLMKFIPLVAPAATIIAAIYVGRITKYLSEKQSEISGRQALTSDRKLKLELFDKRFLVYTSAMRAAEIALMNDNPARQGYDKWPEFEDAIAKTQDGRFLFKSTTYIKMRELVDQADTYHRMVYNYQKRSAIDTDTLRQETEDLNESMSLLKRSYDAFPDECDAEMHLDF